MATTLYTGRLPSHLTERCINDYTELGMPENDKSRTLSKYHSQLLLRMYCSILPKIDDLFSKNNGCSHGEIGLLQFQLNL